MRAIASILGAGVAGLLALPAAASPAPQRVVPCAEIVGRTSFPYPGYRLVLDTVSVPPAFLGQVVPTHERPWAYWRKQGLVVRANGVAVTLTVPVRWRDRVAIAWGYGGKGEPFSSLRLAGCGSREREGNAYAGGFYLRSSAACVPLLVRVGERVSTVRFGLGRRCASRGS